ncbi:MFS transporter [Paenibacillus kandeliae]|uniref:MFS transporter n=1 Tax=Paenibacillus kandeliae TaxID=3231269 RepID=UPI00345B1E98
MQQATRMNDQDKRHGLTALLPYIVAAVIARGADAGAGVGLVLLASSNQQLAHPQLTGALLAAALTAPHVLGPLTARLLDRANDQRRVLAAASLLYGLFVLLTACTVGQIPLFVSIVFAACAGLCGPLLTGGLSSVLSGLVQGDEQQQRRAESWDALTYGISGTLGPAAVAVIATMFSPLLALILLSVSVLVAVVLILWLPLQRRDPHTKESAVSSEQGVFHILLHTGPLRRAIIVMMAAAFPGGAISVIAVAFASAQLGNSAGGGWLVAAFGLGNLAGSLLLTLFPLRGEPERNMLLYTALVAVAFGICALAAQTYVALLLALAVAGAANAPFFAATLGVRSNYAPDHVRGQVFTGMAGFKIASSSAGTALAGVLTGFGAPLLLLAGGIVVGVAYGYALLDRKRSK